MCGMLTGAVMASVVGTIETLIATQARARQAELKLMERELVRLFSDAIVAVSPTLADTALIKPVTMSLFGILNWAYLWFNSSGALSREDYANLVIKLIVDGTRGIVVDRSRGKRRLANRKTPSESSM